MLRVAIPARQARAHRIGGVEHLLRHEGIRDFALPPGVHGVSQVSRKARTRSAKAPGCSISGWCPAAAMSGKARAGNERAIGPAIARRDDAVVVAPQHQRRHGDAREPAIEARIVHVGLPAIEAQRLAVPGIAHDLVVRHGVEIGRMARRVPPAPLRHVARVRVEDVENVRRLAPADLEAERVDQHEFLDAVAGGGGHFRGEPAAEREADDARLLAEPVQQLEIEMHEVVHMAHIVGPRRAAEAGARGRNDLEAPRQKVEKRRPRRNRLEPVQQQEFWPLPSPQRLELDPGHGQSLSGQFHAPATASPKISRSMI